MNKKQLIIAAIVATLSVSGAFAATDITGVTGNNGIFNITPDKLNGEVGYRKYDNFNLSAGDIANLIYKYGNSRDINTFINLVQNGVKIDNIFLYYALNLLYQYYLFHLKMLLLYQPLLLDLSHIRKLN